MWGGNSGEKVVIVQSHGSGLKEWSGVPVVVAGLDEEHQIWVSEEGRNVGKMQEEVVIESSEVCAETLGTALGDERVKETSHCPGDGLV